MPDITMCINQNCLVKERCYRYRAIPSGYQSMAVFEPNSNGLCSYFWNITNERTNPLENSNAYAATVNADMRKESNDV